MSGEAGSLPQMTFKRNVGGRNGRYILGRDPHGFIGLNRSTTHSTGPSNDIRLGGLGHVFSNSGETRDCRRIWYIGIHSKPLERKG